MENVTVYDASVIHEIMPCLSHEFRLKMFFLAGALAIFGIVELFTLKGAAGFIALGIGAAAAAAALIYMKIRVTRSEKKMMQGIRAMHKADSYKSTMRIAAEKIIVTSTGTHAEMLKSELRSVKETKRFYVLQYNSGSYIAVTKNGFTNGTEAEFRQMYKNTDIKY